MLNVFKLAASDSAKHEKYKFWQNEYHAIELNDNTMMDQKLEYVHDNAGRLAQIEGSERLR